MGITTSDHRSDAAPQDRVGAHSCQEQQFCLSLILAINGSISTEKAIKAVSHKINTTEILLPAIKKKEDQWLKQ
tara:strand:+ start:139 stop:360 length:222 start_codon:yes stop_codon:yes gene_type:complete